MIINYPTGSYITVLPAEPEDDESVVYTISNTTPPRSVLDFIQIPTGIQSLQHDARDVPETLRRSNLGDLIFVAKDNKPGATGAGNQLFYPGQTIDATSSQITPVDDVNSSLETQHDQYYVDPTDIDLEQSEYSDVVVNALATQKQVLLELEALQKSKDDLRVEIVNQQRILNEANLVIDGLDVIISNDPDNDEMKDIRTQVQATADAAQATIDELVAELDTIPAAIRSKHSELRALAVLID